MRWIVALLVILSGTPAAAFDAADLVRLKTTGSCPGCDLSEAKLQNFRWPAGIPNPGDLRGANLRGADLGGADLPGVNLNGADLREATLATADLTGASLRGADLSRAFASFLVLSGADASGSTMRDLEACYDQNFSRLILRGADVRNAKLCATNWMAADLTGADLRGADLSYAIELQQGQLDQACGDESTIFQSQMLTIKNCAPGASAKSGTSTK